MQRQNRKGRYGLNALSASAFLAATLIGATAQEATAQSGQLFDHLKCYRIGLKSSEVQVDGHAFDPLTLTPYQSPPFDVEQGCRLLPAQSPRPTHVCIPVDKQPRRIPGGGSIWNAYLLYRVRCPAEPDVEKGFVDQFVRGNGIIRRNTTTRFLLVPAYPSDTPTSPCEPTAPNQCGGDCPNFDETCQLGPGGSCACVQQEPCGGDPIAGQCNGVCEPGASCLPDQLGHCSCLK